MRQNPFSLYDFLGYVFPGALSLILIVFFKELGDSISISEAYEKFVKLIESLNERGTLGIVEETVIVTILSYVLGHIVAYLSSLTVEKFLIWTYGYPSQFLLYKLPNWWYLRIYTSEKQEKYNQLNSNWERIQFQWEVIIELLWRWIIGILLYPISICSLVIGKLFNLKGFLVKPLDETLKNAVKANIESLASFLGIEKDTDNKDDFHRIVYHYEYELQSAHSVKMDNYVALYGFLRGMTFIADMATLWITIRFILPTIKLGAKIDWNLLGVMVVCIGLTFILFLAFMKFYRRFTLECFMCLVVDNSFKKLSKVTMAYHTVLINNGNEHTVSITPNPNTTISQNINSEDFNSLNTGNLREPISDQNV